MSSEFVGKWELVESENFDAYMKHVGFNFLARKVAATLKPTVEITIDGERWRIALITPFKTIVTKFELDREFEEESSDGRQVKSTCHMVNGKLVQKQRAQKPGERDSLIERHVEAGRLFMAMECDGVRATRIYRRVE
ncbi:Fatty acid-binding-like protein 5 [Aphelenchoides fujianensis]|nr:Fatty acid-binding-like protein 5 [Aphelenchoides fujianensis]